MSLRERWNRLDRHTKAVVGIAVAFVVFRAWLATQSAFGFHRGWNEGHYSLIAHGFFTHPLIPNYGNTVVYNVPPLFPYIVAGMFALLGESTFVARLPSILAGGGTVLATYALGRAVYREARTAAIGAFILVLLPYFQLFSGRAQTDVLMLFFFTASLFCIVRGYNPDRGYKWVACGGLLFALGIATKQPVILLPPIVLLWLLTRYPIDAHTLRKTGVLVGASALSLLPLGLWFYLNYLRAPQIFVETWMLELFHRTAPFSNVPLLVLIGFLLGMTPLILTLAGVPAVAWFKQRTRTSVFPAGRPTVLIVWVLVYGAFVFYRTPHGHSYYAVALAPPIALMAGAGYRLIEERTTPGSAVRTAITVVVLLNAALGTVALFELSGDYSIAHGGGDRTTADASQYLNDHVDREDTVYVPAGLYPPIRWYTRASIRHESVESYQVGNLTDERLGSITQNRSGTVYLVYPDPSWDVSPLNNRDSVYRTGPYEFTLMEILGRVVHTRSKFTYYLNDRRLVVYRFASS